MIHTRGLTRHFGVGDQTVEAVRGIDLHVHHGELVALLGPNGAGKSTTFRMLTTLLAPTAGTAAVAGCDVVTDPAGVRRRIGAIGQGNGAGRSQRVRDELVDQGRCYGLSRAAAASRADELFDALELGDLASRVVQTLSGGQRRRLDIAMGLVHRPQLLFLDEPSTGLDPQNRANLADLVRALRSDHGTTIVLTTHYLDEADALADRLVIIDHGRVIADDTPSRLKSELVGDRLEVQVGRRADAGRVAHLVRAITDAPGIDVDRDRVIARVAGAAAAVPLLIRACDADGLAVDGCWVRPATLDDVFLALTGRSLRESAIADRTDNGAIAVHDPTTDRPATIPEEIAS